MRPIYRTEQPEALHRELHKARVVGETAPAPTSQPVHASTGLVGMLLFLWGCIASLWRTKPIPVHEVLEGLPHGVTNATVYVENLRVEHHHGVLEPTIYFCHTRNYLVDRKTLAGADNGKYPDIDRSNLSVDCPLPPNGNYSARLQVSVNGAVNVHIVEFEPKVPKELTQLATAGV